jgi:hypothetical protein
MVEERQAEFTKAALELDSKIKTFVVERPNVRRAQKILFDFHDTMQKINKKYTLPEIGIQAKGHKR